MKEGVLVNSDAHKQPRGANGQWATPEHAAAPQVDLEPQDASPEEWAEPVPQDATPKAPKDMSPEDWAEQEYLKRRRMPRWEGMSPEAASFASSVDMIGIDRARRLAREEQADAAAKWKAAMQPTTKPSRVERLRSRIAHGR